MAPADRGGAEEAEEAKESRPLALIPPAIVTLLAVLGSAAHSDYLLTRTRCRFSLGSLADLENSPLMAQGGAEETEEVDESRPLASTPLAIATLLAILGSAAHGSY
jgi:hypothetical protein